MNERRTAPRRGFPSPPTATASSTLEGCWTVTMEEIMAELDPGWLADAGSPSAQGSRA